MAKKPTVGELIKEARTNKDYSQQKLADMIDGLSASDISKAERGEKELTQAQLKAIAKATGVTQKSLLEAPAGGAAASSSSSSSSTSSAKKSESSSSNKKTESSSSGKKTESSSAKKTDSSDLTITVTKAEKKLVELYRKADDDTKKEVLKLLKGDDSSDMSDLLSSVMSGDKNEILNSVLGTAVDMFMKK